jgi:hypothetical protein
MKRSGTFVAMVIALLGSPVLGQQDGSKSSELHSLQGDMIMDLGNGTGVVSTIWAKGPFLRSELGSGEGMIVTIQRGDMMYTYQPGERAGTKVRLSGFGAQGLIEQIHYLKRHGKRTNSAEIHGVRYDEYYYDNLPQEAAIAHLSIETSLPRFWLSAIRTSETMVTAQKIYYQNMKANVVVDDALFEVPRGVSFTEDKQRSPASRR